MRSGPRPLKASRRVGTRREAGPESPRINAGSKATATTENRLQHVATPSLAPPLECLCVEEPSSWC